MAYLEQQQILGAAFEVEPFAAVRAIVDEVLALKMVGCRDPGLHPQVLALIGDAWNQPPARPP